MKKAALAILAVAAALTSPQVSEAQLSSFSCTGSSVPTTFNFFVGVTPTACAGFYVGNANNGTVEEDAEAALASLGLSGPYSNLQQVTSISNGTIGLSGPFNGTTYIGIHWGGGVFNQYLGGGNGLGTAFFRFDDLDNVASFTLTQEWRQSFSNAALYYTERPCTAPGGCTPVSEPTGIALLSAGFMGLGAMYRRRRKA